MAERNDPMPDRIPAYYAGWCDTGRRTTIIHAVANDGVDYNSRAVCGTYTGIVDRDTSFHGRWDRLSSNARPCHRCETGASTGH